MPIVRNRKMMGCLVPAMLVWAAVGPLPARAGTAAIPENCSAIATALKTSCHATTIFDCGASREAHTYRADEHMVVHVYSPAWELTEFRYAGFEGLRMTAIPGTGVNTRLDQLLQAGSAEETGQFVLNTGMIKDRGYTLSGHIEMTGENPDLGGTVFRKARMHRTFEVKPGAGGMYFRIDLYVSTDPDLFVEGNWARSVFGSEMEEFDQTPYAIAWPGDDGFLATRSERGCDE